MSSTGYICVKKSCDKFEQLSPFDFWGDDRDGNNLKYHKGYNTRIST